MDAYRPPDDLDFDNPYAPPQSSAAPQVTPFHSDFAGIPFSIESIVNAAWSIFKQNSGACLWVVWMVMLINFGLGFALGILLARLQGAMLGDPQSFMFVNFGVNLLSTIFQVWTGIGMNRALIKIVRGEPVSFDTLFSGGPYLVPTILAGIVVGCLFFAAIIVPVLVMTATTVALQNLSAPVGLAFLASGAFLVVLILYLCARLLMFYFLVIDRNAGVSESIGLAWQITHGRAGTIIVIYLMQILLVVAGILALCVGLVFTIPLSNLLMVVTYLAAVGPVKSPERMPLMRWEEDL